MSDTVWVRAHVEQMRETEDYMSFPRDVWEAMTEEQRERELAEFATETMSNAGGCGASVVDESEVPDEYRADES